ncbi:MAG: type II secretion system protein [Candidatus Gracilibacteria bacterium]
MISKKGFTLVEVLLVITIMAIISIAAMTSTINIQKQFVFSNTFKGLLSKVREGRFYAVTQKTVEIDSVQNLPSSYGVFVQNTGTNIEVITFADLADSTTPNGYDNDNTDVLIGPTYTLDNTKYSLKVIGSDSSPNDPSNYDISSSPVNSLTLLYPPSEIKVVPSGETDGETVDFPESTIKLKLTDLSNSQMTKTISIFIRSGIAEETNSQS